MNCTTLTGNPCKCQRLSGTCIRCRQEVAITHGERAPRVDHDGNKLLNYTCLRCR